MHTVTRRAGGEKRGNKYDRIARLSRLSVLADGGPIVPVNVEVSKRRQGRRVVELEPKPFRTVNYCAHCGTDIYCDPATREDERYRAEQDRIDPDGPYTVANLQLSCRRCNLERSNNRDWSPRH